MEKKDIRKLIYERRALLSNEEILTESNKIAETIYSMDAYQKASCLYLYMDCKGEASTKALLEKSWSEGKRTAVPKVEGDDLVFYYIEKYEDTAPGYFQVPEPFTNKVAQEPDALLIVPGVAFDKDRNRCGYGKGFYDRYLSTNAKHVTIAIALDIQMMEAVPFEDTDIRPQKLVTPTTVY